MASPLARPGGAIQAPGMGPCLRLLRTGVWALAVALQLGLIGLRTGAAPHPVTPPPPVPLTGKPAADQASQLVVPLQPDLDLVPKVEPDPQRGLAIRGLVRWRLPAQP